MPLADKSTIAPEIQITPLISVSSQAITTFSSAIAAFCRYRYFFQAIVTFPEAIDSNAGSIITFPASIAAFFSALVTFSAVLVSYSGSITTFSQVIITFSTPIDFF